MEMVRGEFQQEISNLKTQLSQLEKARDNEEIKLPEQPELPADPMANWKIYENEKYGYEIKYPENWNIKDFGMIDIDNPNFTGLSLSSINNLNVEISFNLSNIGRITLVEKSKYSISNQKQSDVAINNIEGIKISGDTIDSGKVIAIFMHYPKEPKNTFIIRLNDYSKLDVFNQVLSTFKFIE